jgi:hypothetical protein
MLNLFGALFCRGERSPVDSHRPAIRRRFAIFLAVVASCAAIAVANTSRRAVADPPAAGDKSQQSAVAPAATATSPPASPAAGLALASIADWKFEELHLKNGRILPGLVKGEDSTGVDFLEIRRPADRPMFLVMFWRFPGDKIDHLTRLPEPDRKLLMSRIDAYNNRYREQEEGQAKIHLEHHGADDDGVWHYGSETWLLGDKPWLLMDSTTDEETTRRSIVRIEQMFAAYSEILPPRTHPMRPLSVKLFGTVREYKSFLKAHGLEIKNPAVFVPEENLLAAGSELSAYSQQFREVRRRHAALLAEYNRKSAQMQAQLAKLPQLLATGGFSTSEQHSIIQLTQSRWNEELARTKSQINAAERQNLEQFDVLTAGMFARLFHEAFHAYLENYVYPQRDHDVPRWLNEGLAQIFESGQLEAGTLRLDAPHAERLKLLQADLQKTKPLSLADVLAANGRQFLVFHPGGEAASERYYLYSWGLAYYLAFRQPVLETAALDRYVDRAAAKSDPIARFEKLVGMPLNQFESRWRAEMLKKPR